jgi:hypothetical protein
MKKLRRRGASHARANMPAARSDDPQHAVAAQADERSTAPAAEIAMSATRSDEPPEDPENPPDAPENAAEHDLATLTKPKAKFATGSLLRHVVVMSVTSSVGLMAMFAVDFVDMLFISMLGVPQLAASIGYSGNILFITTSVSIGISISAVRGGRFFS